MQNPTKEWTSKGLNKPLAKAQPTNLIINYLPSDILDKELLDMFSTFGNIRHYKIIRDTSGHCVGYGFVDFESHRSAHVAQVLVNGRELRQKRLKVAFALPRSSDIAKCNLFIRYVPVNMKEKDLEDLFENYGRIWSVKILCDKYNGLLNAYVRFRQPADAEKARMALDGYLFPRAKHPISVQTARNLRREDPKEDEDLAMENMRENHSLPTENQATDFGPECALETPWSPSPVDEAPSRPEGFIFPEKD